MIKFKDVMFEETFTFVDNETRKVLHIAVAQLQKKLPSMRLETKLIPVEGEMAATLLRDNGVEQHRVERITVKDIKRYPVILLEFADGSQVMADGVHRYTKAHRLGRSHIKALFVPEAMWRPFMVELPGTPPDDLVDRLRTMKSGY